ncbi:MAG: threonine synthase [Elusimicrobia bacterium]|nr:threonine synthase [Elusimicrobiota bacterium]
MANYLTGFKCLGCGKEYGREYDGYVCGSCLDNLDALYDYGGIGRSFAVKKLKNNKTNSVWRYKALFPFDSLDSVPGLDLSLTPLYKSAFLEETCGIEVYLKDDTRLPSASFKDRASAVVMAVAKEKNIDVVACASTGNAGCSWACMGAACGIKVIIYVPETAPRAKIAQLKVYGADIRIVKGTYDDAYDLCVNDSRENNYFNRCTGYNPYTREGKKSVSYEIWEQLGFRAPGTVLVPVGDGNIISGVWKGFRDLKQLGLIEKLPMLIAVQSDKSDAVIRTFEKIRNRENTWQEISVEQVRATTRADSISVDRPRDGTAAVRALLDTRGCGVRVSDDRIIAVISYLAARSGIFVEPAGATSVAGLIKLAEEKSVKIPEPAVCLLTGNGLKDVDAVLGGK